MRGDIECRLAQCGPAAWPGSVSDVQTIGSSREAVLRRAGSIFSNLCELPLLLTESLEHVL